MTFEQNSKNIFHPEAYYPRIPIASFYDPTWEGNRPHRAWVKDQIKKINYLHINKDHEKNEKK